MHTDMTDENSTENKRRRNAEKQKQIGYQEPAGENADDHYNWTRTE